MEDVYVGVYTDVVLVANLNDELVYKKREIIF